MAKHLNKIFSAINRISQWAIWGFKEVVIPLFT
jgi:hypothetical protein